MTVETSEPKAWQRGYPLERLLAIQATYKKYYNQYSLSPFAEVKKHTVAARLADNELMVSQVLDTDGAPLWAFEMKPTKVRTPVTLFQNVVIGHREPGDLQIVNVAADWSDVRWQAVFEELLTDDKVKEHPLWVRVWAEDKTANEYLSRKMQRVGAKVTTFGELYAFYFRDKQTADMFATPRTFAPVPEQHYYGLCRYVPSIVDESVFANFVNAMSTAVATRELSFTNHYSKYNVGKSWGALSLRGYRPEPGFITKPEEMNDKWKAENKDLEFKLQDTELRALFPEVENILSALCQGANWHRIRLMRLAPGGGELQRHTDQVDPDSGVGIGQLMRLHVPLKTNPDVKFSVWKASGEQYTEHIPYGQVWMLDTRWPHMAVNGGTDERIHLVIDVETNEYLLGNLK